MKVLHLISGGELGGSKNHLITLVKSMKGTDINNIVVCFIKGKLYDECIECGIDVRLVQQSKRLDLSIVGRIKDICLNEKIDIVNCHGGRANFIAYFLRKQYAAKYVTTVHSDYKGDYKGNTYKTLIYSNINKIVLKKFDYYITVSQNFKDMLISRGFDKNKIFVVYNGIDFNVDKTYLSREDIQKKYNLRKTNNYVSMVARFHPIKGHRIFIDACKSVLDKVKDVTFILVGDGETMEDTIKYSRFIGIEEGVQFVGFEKPDDFFYLSNFTVLTSYSESFPLSILESAAYSKTVISTDVGGISDLIKDGHSGYLIQPGDSYKLANKMLDLLNNKEKCVDFGTRLHIEAKEKYSLSNLVNNYKNIYNSILGGGISND